MCCVQDRRILWRSHQTTRRVPCQSPSERRTIKWSCSWRSGGVFGGCFEFLFAPGIFDGEALRMAVVEEKLRRSFGEGFFLFSRAVWLQCPMLYRTTLTLGHWWIQQMSSRKCERILTSWWVLLHPWFCKCVWKIHPDSLEKVAGTKGSSWQPAVHNGKRTQSGYVAWAAGGNVNTS